MTKANLHIHTTYSDGVETLDEIIEKAKYYNFDYIAITDHDTLENMDEIKTKDFKIIQGIEMSAKYNSETIHILGYFKDKPSDELRNYLKNESIKREERAKKIIEGLKEYYNIEIDYEDVKKEADGIIARPHIAKVICKKYGRTFDEAFDLYIGDNSKAYVPYDVISLDAAIKRLKENNALVVLAHPILIKKSNYIDIIDKFDGVEVYHPDQPQNFRKELLNIAKEKNLIVTGGSDYHGNIIENKFEEAYIENDDLQNFLKSVNL
ncbi:MAG: PHP domain-containing protein [Firmicutes bacterium]|nr:PHP domain-containing protein [Bacillota bacterium]